MDPKTNYSWLKDDFISQLLRFLRIRKNQNLPNQTANLIFDGHSSPTSIRIIEEVMQNKIELIYQITLQIQFKLVKTKWD